MNIYSSFLANMKDSQRKVLRLPDTVITRDKIAEAERIINPDDEEESRWILNRVFEYLFDVHPYETDGDIALSNIVITYDGIYNAEDVLDCNGYYYSGETVQAIGYALLGVNLYSYETEYETLWSEPDNTDDTDGYNEEKALRDYRDNIAHEVLKAEQQKERERAWDRHIAREPSCWQYD